VASGFDGTVYFVDDDADVLDAAAELLRGTGLWARCFRTADEFLRSISPSDTGCVVLDVRIRDRDGLEVLQQLNARHYHLPVIVITGYGDVPMAVRAMKLGALAFLEKPLEPRALLDEIVKALALARRRGQTPDGRGFLDVELTDDEQRIISGLKRGRTDAEMAAELDVSRRTVQLWKKALFRKCGVVSRRQLLERLFERK
jgi:FixJ family two-component response regulator